MAAISPLPPGMPVDLPGLEWSRPPPRMRSGHKHNGVAIYPTPALPRGAEHRCYKVGLLGPDAYLLGVKAGPQDNRWGNKQPTQTPKGGGRGTRHGNSGGTQTSGGCSPRLAPELNESDDHEQRPTRKLACAPCEIKHTATPRAEVRGDRTPHAPKVQRLAHGARPLLKIAIRFLATPRLRAATNCPC